MIATFTTTVEKKKKQFIKATHRNQVRFKVPEHDKTWYPVDSRKEADAMGNKMVFTSELTEWGMEKYPTNEVITEVKDERKTPTKRNRHNAVNSPSNEKQPDQSD